MNDYFGDVLYINIDERTDRKEEIEEQLNKMDIKFKRFDAVKGEKGDLNCIGCLCSHLEVLTYAKNNNLKNILIFEDDFSFIISKEEFWNEIKTFFDKNIDYDVLMFSYDLKKMSEFDEQLYKVIEAQTASGYLVNCKFYDVLIELFSNSLHMLRFTYKHWLYATDQCWKQLQPTSKWYAFKNRIGIQRPSYSDLTKSFVSYNL